jgi:hypothetical protein
VGTVAPKNLKGPKNSLLLRRPEPVSVCKYINFLGSYFIILQIHYQASDYQIHQIQLYFSSEWIKKMTTKSD